MQNRTRRQLLQAGAAGTVVAGRGAVAGPAAVGASPERLPGVHIHGSLKGGEPIVRRPHRQHSVFGPDTTSWGRGGMLMGSRWDANPGSTGSKREADCPRGEPDWPPSSSCERGEHS